MNLNDEKLENINNPTNFLQNEEILDSKIQSFYEGGIYNSI